MFIARITRQ